MPRQPLRNPPSNGAVRGKPSEEPGFLSEIHSWGENLGEFFHHQVPNVWESEPVLSLLNHWIKWCDLVFQRNCAVILGKYIGMASYLYIIYIYVCICENICVYIVQGPLPPMVWYGIPHALMIIIILQLYI